MLKTIGKLFEGSDGSRALVRRGLDTDEREVIACTLFNRGGGEMDTRNVTIDEVANNEHDVSIGMAEEICEAICDDVDFDDVMKVAEVIEELVAEGHLDDE